MCNEISYEAWEGWIGSAHQDQKRLFCYHKIGKETLALESVTTCSLHSLSDSLWLTLTRSDPSCVLLLPITDIWLLLTQLDSSWLTMCTTVTHYGHSTLVDSYYSCTTVGLETLPMFGVFGLRGVWHLRELVKRLALREPKLVLHLGFQMGFRSCDLNEQL